MNKVLSILSVLVLIGGVIVSVRLVDMDQDFRSRASQEDGIIICHKTGSESNPGNTVRVNENAVQTHLDHGDNFGECENNDQSDSSDQENEVATAEENIESTENNNVADSDDNQNSNSEGEQDQTDNTQNDDIQNNNSENKNEKNIVENIIDAVTGNNNQNNDSTSNSDQNNSESNNNSTVDPSPTIQPVSSKPTDPQNKFIFTLKPTDLDRGTHPIPVSFDFIQNGKSIYKIKSVAYHVSNGLFRGEFEGVSTGNYQVYLKTNSHLGKLFSNVVITSGNTNWDFSASRLIVGDFNNDNNLNIYDIGEFLSEYNSTKVTAVTQNQKYDLNHDGFIDKNDLDILLANYKQFNLKGDNF